MSEDFLYSRCCDCHKLIDDDDYCTVNFGPYYFNTNWPYMDIGRGLIFMDSIKDHAIFSCFMKNLFDFFLKELYIRCLGCSCDPWKGIIQFIKKKDFMELEPRLHNRIVGFSFISG